ncbi:hypothetical protein LTR10_017194 [Elasticomyces elasticus]|uniref:Protein kinase domain-containing protein n=1 Tax=Exophiala sideris TaxID=1016849 RepID=A0ABR0J5J7_9EURO|nr:hypothetical protein LTR10_017194 [Elasticomyces elasticus]KAK5028450.1 hypothetical protein LTS07_006541 [Exophiala sideris]KAK5035907.1 hypothetical protein LTR13_005477 [Exophiala sideris]KAK5056943.1 hypothetical protein LTR69_007581 [Exophiala sideris]KAK5181350.1 hypothetical protein LTR44_006145 [Eurotiomycetes sp. CCFEE 6388]
MFALQPDEDGECIREDENIELPPLDLAFQEGFLMIAQRLLYQHELKMFDCVKDLPYFPKLIAAGNVCTINTEQPQPVSDPDSHRHRFVCPAIIMELLPGESLANLTGSRSEESRRKMYGLPAQDIPSHSIPFKPTEDEWHAIHLGLHERAVYGLWCRGIQHGDLHAHNIVLAQNSSQVWDPMLVDMGALKCLETPYSPIQLLNRSSNGSFKASINQSVPGSSDFLWDKKYDTNFEDTLDWIMKDRAPEYAKSATFHTVSTQRFRCLSTRGRGALHHNVWRLLMESLFSDLTEHSTKRLHIGARVSSVPITPSSVAIVLRYVRQLMEKEWRRQDYEATVGSWYARAVSLITLFATSRNIAWSPEDSQIVETKLRQCDESFSKQVSEIRDSDRGFIRLDEIQTWASNSTYVGGFYLARVASG